MKALIALAISLALTAPAVAQNIRIVVKGPNEPVVMQGDQILSSVQPADMNLRPLDSSGYGFVNDARQVVIKVPEGRSVRILRD